MKKIKSIDTKNFSVELFEIELNYIIAYATPTETVISEKINDYIMAGYLFDLKVQELERQ